MIETQVVTEFVKGFLQNAETEETGVVDRQPVEGNDSGPSSDVRLPEDEIQRVDVEVDLCHYENVLPVGPSPHLQELGSAVLVSARVMGG